MIRSVIMSAREVVATLEGRKTQLRMVVRPRPEFIGGKGEEADASLWGWACPSGAWVVLDQSLPPYCGEDYSVSHESYAAACPLGQPGDRVSVLERFAFPASMDGDAPSTIAAKCIDAGYTSPWCPTWYAADGYETPTASLGPELKTRGRWRSPSHMPVWAARLVIVLDGVRAERVQDISEADAEREGMVGPPDRKGTMDWLPACRRAFRAGWDETRGTRPGCSWGDDPWVWAIDYHVQTATERWATKETR